MIELKITGSDANEVYQQMLDLAKAPQFYFHPWEAPQSATIEPDPIVACDQDVPVKQEEKKEQTAPSPQAERGPSPKPAPTTEVVRAMAVAFAKQNGKEAMRLLLDKLGTKNVSSLDEDGRRLAVQLMEDATHA